MQSATPENLILLCGELTSGGEKIHALDGMNAREFTIKVVLPSGTDLLPVLIPEALIDDTVAIGATVSVTGKLISEEQTENGETRTFLKIAVQELYAGETEVTSGLFLTGNVIKKPHSYTLPSGERTEFPLAVGKADGEVAYVFVAAEGELAAAAKNLSLGDSVSLLGQLHSYEYLSLGCTSADSYTAYEVAVLTFITLPAL